MVPIPASRDDLAIEFVNTRYWRGSEAPTEDLPDFGALRAWLARVRLPAEMLATVADAGEAALYGEAIEARETMHRIFAALAEGNTVAEEDLAALNRALAASPPRARLARKDGIYAWAAEPSKASAATLLAPVLWSAADLLLRADRLAIRRCANTKCLWLFIDRSKAGTRRWCDMAACGNRAKAQRHYLRSKEAPR